MNYKRKSPRSSSSSKCGICCGQRRHFGWGNLKTRARMKIANRELVRGEV